MNQFITFMGEDLINALGWTFVHTLWQGCVIVLLMIFVLQQIPAKKANMRYTVAAASMISMLIAAAATFALLYFEPGKSDAILGNSTVFAENNDGGAGFSLVNWLGNNLSAMVAIWTVGVVLLACRLLFGLAYIQYLRNTASDLTYELGGRLNVIARKLNFKRSLDVAESAFVQIPVVVGHLKPLILFPVGAINQLTIEEVEAVLAHEIAHLVRNDFIQNLIQSVIEIIFYYHPAVWWISAVVRSERENCCDDLAIKVCGSSLTYARALVRLQEVGHSSPALALPFSGSKNHLLNRVKRILNEPQNKSNLMEKITATCLLLLCLIFASFSESMNETAREAIDVPAMLVSNHFVHFDNSFVSDTIIPRTSRTIVHGDADGKEVRLEFENGEITGLFIDGEEVPSSRYHEYSEEMAVLEQSISPVSPIAPVHPMPDMPPMPPMPPMPAMPDMPTMPDMPPMPTMPDMPPMPPMPPMPTMPDMPPMPPMPDMPPIPDLEGAHFDFKYDNGMAPMVYAFEPTTTRTESTIIREYDENGKVSYRVEGEFAGDTKIQINEATGIATIDGTEITIDADEIVVIEEIETTPGARAFFTAPESNWNSEEYKKQWIENWNQDEWNAQWKENWNEDAWKAYWEKNKDQWHDANQVWKWKMEEGENGDVQLKSYQDALENYNFKFKELEGHEGELKIYLEHVEKARSDNMQDAEESLLHAQELVKRERIARDISKEDVEKIRQDHEQAMKAAKKAKEDQLKSDSLKKGDKKDQSSVDDPGDLRFYSYTAHDDSDNVTVIKRINNDNVTLTADLLEFDSDSHVMSLTRNVELAVNEVVLSGDHKIAYVLSPDGGEGLKGYTVHVTADNAKLSDDQEAGAKLIDYKVKLVKEVDSEDIKKDEIKTQKHQ